MSLKSTAAKIFLVLAGVFALLTAWETFDVILQMDELGLSDSQRLGTSLGYLGRWLIDPIFLAASALMIEMLERIWLALKARGPSEE